MYMLLSSDSSDLTIDHERDKKAEEKKTTNKQNQHKEYFGHTKSVGFLSVSFTSRLFFLIYCDAFREPRVNVCEMIMFEMRTPLRTNILISVFNVYAYVVIKCVCNGDNIDLNHESRSPHRTTLSLITWMSQHSQFYTCVRSVFLFFFFSVAEQPKKYYIWLYALN